MRAHSFLAVFIYSVVAVSATAEIFVANTFDDSVTVYENTDDGNAAPKRTIAGASTDLCEPKAVSVQGGEVFVLNWGCDEVTVYLEGDDGDVAPQRKITGLSFAIDMDVYGDEIFIAKYDDSIDVFDTTDSGFATPNRTISGAATGIDGAVGVSVLNDEIFLANAGGSVTVYDLTDSGDVAPKRTISGGATGLYQPSAIGTGSIYVSVYDEIVVFDTTASGNVSPTATIAGSNTRFDADSEGGYGPEQMYVVGDELFVPNSLLDIVIVHDKAATGNATPLRVIEGAATDLAGPLGVFVTVASASVPAFSGGARSVLAVALVGVLIIAVRGGTRRSGASGS